MKRRILSIVAILLLFTFTFSLVACDSVFPESTFDEDLDDTKDAVGGSDGDEINQSQIIIPNQNATPNQSESETDVEIPTGTEEDETPKYTIPDFDLDDFPYHTEFDTSFTFEYNSEYDVNVDMNMNVDINVNTEASQTKDPAQTEKPTEAPTQKPTEAPTEKPTEAPTQKPTEAPTEKPTEAPTEKPTEAPTEKPTEAPTEKPTEAPTEKPTEAPTEKPTEAPTETETEADEGKIKIRFGTYNIKHGEMDPTLKKIAANIVNTNLDIVALQEVDKGTNRSGKVDQMKLLSQLTGYKYYAFFKAINHDGGEYGVGLLSKYPFENTKVWDLPNGSYENRIIARAQIRLEGTLLNFYVTHLTPDFESKSVRTQQFAQIASIVKSNSNFMIGGDFNTGTFSEFSVLGNHATQVTTILNRTSQKVPTEPASNQPIDNVSYRRWTFGAPQVVKNSYSDHYMLWGDAVFNA